MTLAKAWIVLCCAVVLMMVVISALCPNPWGRAFAALCGAIYGAAFNQWRNEIKAWKSKGQV